MTARARSTEPRRRRRLPAPERRARIVAAARELFTTAGIERTTMRAVARRAGITPTVIYQHFADKDALLFDVCEAFFDKLIAYKTRAVAGAGGPAEKLRAMMRAYVDCGLDHPHEYRLTFMTPLPRLKAAQVRRFRAVMRTGAPPPEAMPRGVRAFAMLEGHIRGMMDAGLVRRGDAAAMAESVWAAGHGLVSLVITHEGFGFSKRRRLTEASLDMALHGVLAPGRS